MGSIRTGMIIVCATVITVAFLPRLPSFLFLLFFSLLTLAVFFIKPTRFLLLFLLPFLVGLLWGSGYGYLGLAQRLPPDLEGADVWVDGEVLGMPVLSQRSQRFELKVLAVEYQGRTLENVLKKVRVNWYQTEIKLQPGQRWRLLLRLKRPHGFANPGGFDYQGWLFQQGIGATGYVRKHENNRLIRASDYHQLLAQGRYLLYQRLSARLDGQENKGLMLALLMGERRDVGRDQWQLLSRTGTNHLFVISGLHVGFVALCAYLLFFNFSRLLLIGPPRFAAQQVGVVAALLASFGYAAVAGFSLPTQRALIMLVVMLAGRLVRRRVNVWHSYFMALLLVLLWDPLAAQSVGFWLSFGAVGSLLYAFGLRTDSRGFWWRWLRPQYVVFIAFLPVLLFFFQQASLISPLVNVVAIPVVGFFMVPLCLLMVLLEITLWITGFIAIETLAVWLSVLTSATLERLVSFLQSMAMVPFSQWHNNVSLASLLCACGGVLLWLAPRGLPARWLGSLCFLPLLLNSQSGPQIGRAQITVLDVGQGLSVHVRTHQHNLIYDVGARYGDRFDMASSVVLPYLRKQGVISLDRVIVSHGDNDHAGALPVLLADMPVKEVISGASKKPGHSADAQACKDGLSWQWDKVEFQLMQVGPQGWTNENNRSCVLRVSTDNLSVLIPGDIETSAERALISQYGENLKSDVLLAAHHGSLTSSSTEFIDQVSPRWVIVSSGYRNRFGHPHEQVVERFQVRAINVINTAEQGAIRVTADREKKGPLVSSHRQQSRRYWF